MGCQPFQSNGLCVSVCMIFLSLSLLCSISFNFSFNLSSVFYTYLPKSFPAKGCATIGGALIDTDYAKPVPWIGLYIAVASLACAFAMAMDLIRSLRHREFWFPRRYFSLNATTLALLSIATKLPVDLNSKMPRSVDQLSKLSGTVFLCSAMGNLLPSIGSKASSEILSNVVALAILVITIVVNICIQIRTGVIYEFIPEHVAVIFLLIILLLIFISCAIAVPTTKETMDKIYARKFMEIISDPQGRNDLDNNLHIPVENFWLMAHSGDTQYVLVRSANSTAAGWVCYAAYIILAQALWRGLRTKSNLRICGGTSDYAWSSPAVLAVQYVAAFVGAIAPAHRWFHAVRLRRSSWRHDFKVEEYWTRLLVKWKEAPLNDVSRRNLAKIVHQITIISLWILINIQIVVVSASKVFRFLSGIPEQFLMDLAARITHDSTTELRDDYVMSLEGEEDLVSLIVLTEGRVLERWIEKGRKKRPAAMIQLIEEHSTCRTGFTHVDRVLPAEPPPNCWALSLVTLAAVAAALRTTGDEEEVKSLLLAVGEGLPYVRLVEKQLDTKGLLKLRAAADIVWMKLRLYNKWLDVELIETRGARREKTVLERLRREAAERREEFLEGIDEETSLELPETTLAAVCMERVCGRILQAREVNNGSLLPWVRTVMADILGACLTNLSQAIFNECCCKTVELREESVRDAARVLGETEEILQLLQEPCVARLWPEGGEYIDGWRRDV